MRKRKLAQWQVEQMLADRAYKPQYYRGPVSRAIPVEGRVFTRPIPTPQTALWGIKNER